MSTLTEALAPKSDQLNADDLIPGPRTLTITGAKIARSERQLRVTLNYEGDNGKPFKPCKTMARAMVMVWSITDENYEEQFVGKSIRVYRDPEVKFGDQGAVGGIRISHMSHIDKPVTVKLTVSQGKKSNFVFQPLPKLAASNGDNDAAGKWANQYLAKVKTFATLDALNAFASDKATRLADLENALPNAHRQCVEALEAKRASFGTSSWDDDDLDENPNANHGEQFNDTPEETARAEQVIGEVEDKPLWQSHADRVGDLIAAATDQRSWKKADDEFVKVKAGLPDEIASSVQLALDAKRDALRGQS